VHFEPWLARGRAPAAGWGQVDQERMVAGLAEAVASLAAFVEADRVTLARVTPSRLRAALRRALAHATGPAPGPS
jgi:hypothetical protein